MGVKTRTGIRMKRRTAAILGTAFLLVIAAIVAITGTLFDPSLVHGGPADSQNVTVTLNVTNTEPRIYETVFDDLTADPADQIVLSAGGITEVYCNASASDPNGQGDLVNATANIYSIGIGTDLFSADSKASHYTNSTCMEYVNVGGTTNNRTFTCRFNVDYFAFNTSWQCNMTVRDFGGAQSPENKLFFNSTGTDTALVNSLLAINISTSAIDYGNLSVTETSAMQAVNITNAGNIGTNFTIRGFGGSNDTADSTNLNFTSMICDTGNISIGQNRYSNNASDAAWANMINLTFNASLANAFLGNRTSENDPMADLTTNVTYWKIKVPLSVGGLCNGTIQFAATLDSA